MRTLIQSLPHAVGNTLLMLRRIREGFYEDGLLTITNADFRRSDRFTRSYRAAKDTGSFQNWELRWRIHVLCWAASHASSAPGDFVECGVDHGGTAVAVIEYLDFARLGKSFWLLDTFNGIDQSLLTERETKTAGFLNYDDCFERVKQTFDSMDFVKLVRGSVPATLPLVPVGRVAFLHIDMNSTVPEIAALEHFWPILSPSGVVVLDDYGWPRHKEQKAGFDDFAGRHGIEILQLPTGQGIILKDYR